jgi:hypothetical protein
MGTKLIASPMSRSTISRILAHSAVAGIAFSMVGPPSAGARASSSPAAASSGPRDGAFDLAVQEVDVRQTASTPMFREVAVKCVVQNRGPSVSRGSEMLVISKPGDDGPKVLKASPIPVPLTRGEKFVLDAEGAAWFASSVPYRCEIQWDGSVAGDADPSDDYGEFTYPKL